MRQLISLGLELVKNPWQRKFIIPLVVINLLGSAYGYYWYHGQLAETPFYAWPFVPDSPLATTIFALVLWGYLAGLRGGLYGAVACTACIKYGLWAVVIISHYWHVSGDITPVDLMLWTSHLGMVAQGIIYLRGVPLTGGVVIVTAGWMALNDFADYAYGLHPYLFGPGQLGLAAATAMALTVSLSLLLVLVERHLSRRHSRYRGK